MKFDSKMVDLGGFEAAWPEEYVKNEPMFFNCDLNFAYRKGGPITEEFINNLPEDWKNSGAVLDSRVHMLMPKWYPCIPGYHHDDVPRTAPNGQPNYYNPHYRSEHLMGLVNGHICPTEFAVGEFEVGSPDPMRLEPIYKRWHRDVEWNLEMGYAQRVNAESGRYIQFDCDAFHTGTAAVANGWRWFIRLSRNTDRQAKITNEIRRQVQVYMDNLTEGW